MVATVAMVGDLFIVYVIANVDNAVLYAAWHVWPDPLRKCKLILHMSHVDNASFRLYSFVNSFFLRVPTH